MDFSQPVRGKVFDSDGVVVDRIDDEGNSYTAAPLRTGEWGDVEFKTVFEPDYDKKTYLDKFSWGGPHFPASIAVSRMHP